MCNSGHFWTDGYRVNLNSIVCCIICCGEVHAVRCIAACRIYENIRILHIVKGDVSLLCQLIDIGIVIANLYSKVG